MIQLENCSKLFGNSLALKSVSIKLSKPGLVLVLGANAAGKSTLLRACAGLLTLSSGKTFNSKPLAYLGHHLMLYPHLTVKENLDFFASMQGASTANSECDLDWLEIEAMSSKFVSTLSQGQKSRVGLARVLQGSENKTLLLDEPSAAFDQRWQEIFVTKLEVLSKLRLIMLVTHDPEKYLSFASRVLVIERGSIAHDFDMTAKLNTEIVLQAYREVLR